MGTIHLGRRQIYTIFDPYPPTIGMPAKCLWRGFLILKYCDLFTIGTWGHLPPPAYILNGWSLDTLFFDFVCSVLCLFGANHFYCSKSTPSNLGHKHQNFNTMTTTFNNAFSSAVMYVSIIKNWSPFKLNSI